MSVLHIYSLVEYITLCILHQVLFTHEPYERMSTDRTGCYFELYQDATDEYRWRFWGPRGRLIALSGEGYSNRTDCIAAINRLCTVARSGLTIISAPGTQD
jgi:uncharacterized protein YegP (UPF0339 family)